MVREHYVTEEERSIDVGLDCLLNEILPFENDWEVQRDLLIFYIEGMRHHITYLMDYYQKTGDPQDLKKANRLSTILSIYVGYLNQRSKPI
jgi:hypothetical protein